MNTRDKVLLLLEGKRGKSVSGAQIARQLGLTRSSVWKAVKELEKDGYRVDSAPGKGYTLLEENDILSLPGILPYLDDKGLADRIEVHACLPSTNTTAKQIAISGGGHGAAVIAAAQSAGTGRFGREFASPPGGLYLSIVLRPEKLWFEHELITLYSAVCVCQAFEQVGVEPKIKWVNDLFLDGKKVCGISTEAVSDLESGTVGWIVIGIGINLTTPPESFPPHLDGKAGSVFPEGKSAISASRLAGELINRLVTPKQKIPSQEIPLEYKRRMFMLGRQVLVSGGRESYTAAALDIDQKGRLIVMDAAGQTHTLFTGEVSILPIP